MNLDTASYSVEKRCVENRSTYMYRTRRDAGAMLKNQFHNSTMSKDNVGALLDLSDQIVDAIEFSVSLRINKSLGLHHNLSLTLNMRLRLSPR